MSIFDKSRNELLSAYNVGATEIDYAYDSTGVVVFSKETPPTPPTPVYDIGLHLIHSSYPISGSPQGMATFGNYIFQFFSGVDTLNVYKLDDFSFVNSMPCHVIGHGNNLQFGKQVQANGFPLLYCSDSNTADARYIYVLSVTTNSFELVDTIVLPAGVGNFPNAVIDFDNELIYTIGYTADSVHTSSGKNLFCKLDLNVPSNIISVVELNYLGVLNGLVWDGNHVVINCNSYGSQYVKFYFLEQNGTIAKTEQFSKEYQSPLDSEFQGFAYEITYYLVSKWVYKNVPSERTLYYEFYSYVPDWGD